MQSLSCSIRAMATKVNYNVVHNAEKKRFEIALPNQETAFLEYEEYEPGKLEYFHTEVPPSQKGKGLGNILAKAAFDWAAQSNKKVLPTCWFLRDVFLPKNSAYQNIVIENNPPKNSKM
jgi:predicted GNAT family acetyltransferase